MLWEFFVKTGTPLRHSEDCKQAYRVRCARFTRDTKDLAIADMYKKKI